MWLQNVFVTATTEAVNAASGAFSSHYNCAAEKVGESVVFPCTFLPLFLSTFMSIILPRNSLFTLFIFLQFFQSILVHLFICWNFQIWNCIFVLNLFWREYWKYLNYCFWYFFLIEKKIFFTVNNLNQKRYVLAHYFCLALLARHRRYTWFLQSWKHDNKIEDVRFKRADHTLLFYQHIAEYSSVQLNTFFLKIQEKIETNEKITHEKILFWKIRMFNLNLIWKSKVKKYDNNQMNIFLNMKYLFIGWKILWDEIHHEWKRLRNNT